MFTRVLLELQIVQNVAAANQKVDRMWERLVELVLFARSGKHRGAGQILRNFITNKQEPKINAGELNRLKAVFGFLDKAYKDTDLGESRLARDLPHFYTVVTSLLVSDLAQPIKGRGPDYFLKLRKKLVAFAKLLQDNAKPSKNKVIASKMEEYKEAAARQTTHPGRRQARQESFLAIIERL